MKELIEIQFRLNAPKNQYNSFGKYKYRSCEDILAAVKPLLKENGCILLLSDDVKEIGSAYSYSTSDPKKGTTNYNGTRVYVVATATIINSQGEKISVSAMAREEPAKAGMDSAQITGSTSSYARKYALNGLFAIDDNKDADALNVNKEYTQPVQQGNDLEDAFLLIKANIENATSRQYLQEIHDKNVALHNYKPYRDAMNKRFKEVA